VAAPDGAPHPACRDPATTLPPATEEPGQDTSFAFGRRLGASELVASMGTVGDALDNAVAESFFATLQCELLDRYPWPTRTGLRTAIFDFIEVFYNRQRRHSTLDDHPPAAYEQHHPSPASAAQPPCQRKRGNSSTSGLPARLLKCQTPQRRSTGRPVGPGGCTGPLTRGGEDTASARRPGR
jgi:Integrase core domain